MQKILKRKRKIKTDAQMVQILWLTETDFKITLINMLKKIEEMMEC